MIHSAIITTCTVLGLLTWYFSKPLSVRFYETKSEEYLSVEVTPDIKIALDSSSSIAVTDNRPLRMELFKGNIYFDVRKDAADKPSIKVGETLIEDIGTRFSVRMLKDGSNIISVAEGQVKVHVASGDYLISALEQADFDNFSISRHRLITEREVAPWHTDRNALSF